MPGRWGCGCVAVDVADDKLALARSLGAEATVNAKSEDPAGWINREIGGVHGALVTAVSTTAFHQAIGMLRRHGTLALVGLPPGTFPTPIFDVVLKRLTIRGSIVGTRLDLTEALAFAGEGAVAAHFSWDKLDNVNAVFDRMRAGEIEGRVVLDLQ